MIVGAGQLRRLFSYDPETGIFRRKICCRGSAAGSIAGGLNSKGYVVIRIDLKQYRAHRLAWLYMTGEWPVHEIDHINLVKSDNRWANLRPATTSQNAANRRSWTGRPKGAYFDKRTGKFQALIVKDRKQYNLGTFDTREGAYEAYARAARELFGEFARLE